MGSLLQEADEEAQSVESMVIFQRRSSDGANSPQQFKSGNGPSRRDTGQEKVERDLTDHVTRGPDRLA